MKRVFISSLFVLVVLVLLVVVLLPLKPGINREGYNSIRKGMLEKEVIATLGFPPGYYLTAPAIVQVTTGVEGHKRWIPIKEFREIELPSTVRVWYGNRGVVLIRFDAHGCVVRKHFFDVAGADESFVTSLRRWLRNVVIVEE